jgi:hypothetical protein
MQNGENAGPRTIRAAGTIKVLRLRGYTLQRFTVRGRDPCRAETQKPRSSSPLRVAAKASLFAT